MGLTVEVIRFGSFILKCFLFKMYYANNLRTVQSKEKHVGVKNEINLVMY